MIINNTRTYYFFPKYAWLIMLLILFPFVYDWFNQALWYEYTYFRYKDIEIFQNFNFLFKFFTIIFFLHVWLVIKSVYNFITNTVFVWNQKIRVGMKSLLLSDINEIVLSFWDNANYWCIIFYDVNWDYIRLSLFDIWYSSFIRIIRLFKEFEFQNFEYLWIDENNISSSLRSIYFANMKNKLIWIAVTFWISLYFLIDLWIVQFKAPDPSNITFDKVDFLSKQWLKNIYSYEYFNGWASDTEQIWDLNNLLGKWNYELTQNEFKVLNNIRWKHINAATTLYFDYTKDWDRWILVNFSSVNWCSQLPWRWCYLLVILLDKYRTPVCNIDKKIMDNDGWFSIILSPYKDFLWKSAKFCHYSTEASDIKYIRFSLWIDNDSWYPADFTINKFKYDYHK